MSTDNRTNEDPRAMSAAELSDYLDELVEAGKGDMPEFHRAYKVWEESE